MSTIFTTSIQNKLWIEPSDTLEDLVCMLRDVADSLECMFEDGVKLDSQSNVEDDYLVFVTNDISVANKYFMELDEEDSESEEDDSQEELSVNSDFDCEDELSLDLEDEPL